MKQFLFPHEQIKKLSKTTYNSPSKVDLCKDMCVTPHGPTTYYYIHDINSYHFVITVDNLSESQQYGTQNLTKELFCNMHCYSIK